MPTPLMIEADGNEVPSTTTDPATNCAHEGKGSENNVVSWNISCIHNRSCIRNRITNRRKALSPILIVFKIALSILLK